ncbi:hypothetical protein BH20ACI1_BH20ACI1_00380 [soil metagenome]
MPSDVIQNSNLFGGAGSLDFSDISGQSGHALKIAEIYRNIQDGNKIMAIKVFRETFGGSLMEAKKAVDDLESGKSVDISGMRIQAANALNIGAKKKSPFAPDKTVWAAIIISSVLLVGLIGLLIFALIYR